MKARRPWPASSTLGLAVLAFACTGAAADPRTEELRRCLADFDGLQLRLPYQPPMHIRTCATDKLAYGTDPTNAAGLRVLELQSDLTLGPGPSGLDSDHSYAMLQAALLAHLEVLFRQRAYRRVAVEHGDARTRRDPNTMRMLQGLPAIPESEEESARREAALPPIPFVRMARYVRAGADGGQVTLTFKSEAKNTWRITLEGVPPLPAAAGAAR